MKIGHVLAFPRISIACFVDSQWLLMISDLAFRRALSRFQMSELFPRFHRGYCDVLTSLFVSCLHKFLLRLPSFCQDFPGLPRIAQLCPVRRIFYSTDSHGYKACLKVFLALLCGFMVATFF